jgi:NADH-quinone oxidoreductase subunit D
MMYELVRIGNHILGITTLAMDIGIMNTMLWGFEEREELVNYNEVLTGGRMHTTLIGIGEVRYDVPYSYVYLIF